jgi:uncharacterized SAM-binding protein YcdF (DUF218 family)
VRLIAVLGYSNGGSTLHEICGERLQRAEAEATAGDVVLLSGWARHGGARSEAELMAEAWRGPAAELVLSGDARSTAGNAQAAAETAIRIGATEVVLVTSAWHERRAAALFRAALRGTGVRLALAAADGTGASSARLRELACWLLVPVQAALVRRRPV